MNDKTNYLRKPILLTSLPFGVMSFLIPIYSKQLDMDAVQIAGLFSVLSLALIIMRPFVGKAIDSFGRKPVLTCSCVLFAISYFIFSIANTPVLMYVARIFQGIATATMTISTYSIISDTTKDNNFSKAFGKIHSYKSTGSLYGCIIASFILSYMMFIQGWRLLFAIFSILSFYSVVEVIKKVPESKKLSIEKNNINQDNSKDTTKLLIIVFITCLSSSILGPIFMIYMQDKFTNNLILLAYAFFPALLCESLFSKEIGIFSDKRGNKYSMVLGIVICGIVSIITPSANSLVMLSILWIVSTLSGVLYSVSEKNAYTDMINESSVGIMYSVYSIVCDFGLMIGPIIGGILYDNVSHQAPFYLSGFLMFIVAVLVLVLIKENIEKNTQLL